MIIHDDIVIYALKAEIDTSLGKRITEGIDNLIQRRMSLYIGSHYK